MPKLLCWFSKNWWENGTGPQNKTLDNNNNMPNLACHKPKLQGQVTKYKLSK